MRFTRIFGDNLFRVNSQVQLHPSWIQNIIELIQLRDIRLSVVNTINDDQSRVLTYVTSPDFVDLEYQSYTELKQKKNFPWFWVGLGAGVITATGVAAIIRWLIGSQIAKHERFLM